MGDIHHFAWRCKSSSCTHYIDKRFGELYGNFSSTVRASQRNNHSPKTTGPYFILFGHVLGYLAVRHPISFLARNAFLTHFTPLLRIARDPLAAWTVTQTWMCWLIAQQSLLSSRKSSLSCGLIARPLSRLPAWHGLPSTSLG